MTRIMMRSALCLLALTWNTPVQSFQIVPATQAIGCPRVSVSYFSSLGCLQAKRSFEDEEEESMSIPQLPAFGASSFSNSHVDFSTSMSPSPKSDNPDTAFVTPKFKLQYTCNVCETRNSHMVSRLGKLMWFYPLENTLRFQ